MNFLEIFFSYSLWIGAGWLILNTVAVSAVLECMGQPTIASECKQNINNQILRNDFEKWYIMGLVPWYIISQNHFSKFVALSIIYYYFWNEISEKVVFVKWNITTHDLANQNNFINSWLGFASSFVYEIILICLVIRCDISFHKNHFFRNSTFPNRVT